MTGKIFRSSIVTALLVLLAALVLIMGVLFDIFEKQLLTELESEAVYLSHAVENEGASYFDGFNSQTKRITLISPDGMVLFDTDTRAAALDNHADREEVKEAVQNGKGTSIRYSKTLTEKTVYYAVRLSDGNILRVSANRYTVFTILMSLAQPIAVVLAIALILTLILSSRVSKSIMKPINEIDPENPESTVTYDELTPLLHKLAAQKKTILGQLEAARQKQMEFRLITENMSEGFLVIDHNQSLLTYNTAALKLLGISGSPSGSVLSICRIKEFRDMLNTVLSGERTIEHMETDGRIYRLIANPVFNGSLVIGAVIVIVDATESEKRETLRREFTANVSHELKTPLTSISGFAELMKDGGTPEETVVDFSEMIYNEAQRLINLVNDIIKISELDEKNIYCENEAVDLYELSKSIMKRLAPQAEKRNISFNITGSSVKVNGSAKILDEMLYNLCDNAVKYNKDNGTVDIILSSSDNNVSITVRDSGIGIPVSHQNRVFERFYRVDKSHSKEVGGTGLGLAIVKHGAAFHDAEIQLDSVEGKGTSITVTFNSSSH